MTNDHTAPPARRRNYMTRTFILLTLTLVVLGCHHGGDDCDANGRRRGSYGGPAADRPFPLGQVTDSHWETQQTNAEAADFIFYDHEFRYDTTQHVETAQLSPLA